MQNLKIHLPILRFDLNEITNQTVNLHSFACTAQHSTTHNHTSSLSTVSVGAFNSQIKQT